MNTNNQIALPWTKEEFDNFGKKVQIAKHGYHTIPLFQKDALIRVLDNYPHQAIRCYTMGSDPCKPDDWRNVDLDPKTTGAEMWQAVEKGRIWINVLKVEENHPEFAELIKGMYRQLSAQCRHLINPKPAMSNLILSGPGAMVYYHLDAEPNMLWHISGEKKIWIYPDMDMRFVSQTSLENIFAGVAGENLPYDPSFDDSASSYVLQPGEVASWPHNAPHRVVNTDMNVSLATSYVTDDIYGRKYVQLANKYIVRQLGIDSPSMGESGVIASTKRLAYRVANKIRPFKKRDFARKDFSTDLLLDPESPNGLKTLNTKVVPHFILKKQAQ